MAQFENETLPKTLWTHEAHLAVGLSYVLSEGKEKALQKIRPNIKKYNVATGGENTDRNGYHETITVFWIWAIDRFLQTADLTLSEEILFQELLVSNYSSKNFPFEYYSREHLLSRASRLNLTEPNLRPMK